MPKFLKSDKKVRDGQIQIDEIVDGLVDGLDDEVINQPEDDDESTDIGASGMTAGQLDELKTRVLEKLDHCTALYEKLKEPIRKTDIAPKLTSKLRMKSRKNFLPYVLRPTPLNVCALF